MDNKNTKAKNESVKRALTYYMALRGKNQSDICSNLNLTSSTVSEWCTGKRVPRSDRLQDLSNYLDIPMDQFFNFQYPSTEQTVRDKVIKELDNNSSFLDFVSLSLGLEKDKLDVLTMLVKKML